MTLVVPGVEVQVVKEVVAPQLSPSGVLGLVGLTEKIPDGLTPVQSWSSFLTAFGTASAFSLPEASQAISNGVYEVVVSPVATGDAVAMAAAADIPADGAPTSTAVHVAARARGLWGNNLSVVVAVRNAISGGKQIDLQVIRGSAEVIETIRGIPMGVTGADPLDKAITARSQVLIATPGTAPTATPAAGKYALTGGKDASASGYTDALAALENDPDVDMILVAIQDFSDPKEVAAIYSNVVSHCTRMSANSKGRIGFGQVPLGTADVSTWVPLSDSVHSDRFVLLAPNGVVGAVAGMIGGLEYFQSPTFKTVAGLTDLSRNLTVEEQTQLLQANIVPVASQRGRGTIVLRGLTTDGDQISVRRVADHAVREVKLIGDLFIGRLNNEEGRGALKQKLTEALVQMQKDGALVPSTDGKDPAFKLNVYSSQQDFSQGIVRVDMAVRPVRAIDYIYATVLVQV
jgi:hypothetical protein